MTTRKDEEKGPDPTLEERKDEAEAARAAEKAEREAERAARKAEKEAEKAAEEAVEPEPIDPAFPPRPTQLPA